MTSSSDTSTPSPATRPLAGWMKGTMLAGFIFFVCWGCAISCWRTTRSAPGSGALAGYLLGLPSLLVLGLFAGQKLVAARRAAPAQSQQPAPAREAPAAPEKTAPLAILGAALRSAHGVSPEELATAITAGKARADLDPELVDDKGFPVMSVRSPDAGIQRQRADRECKAVADGFFAAHGFGQQAVGAQGRGQAQQPRLLAEGIGKEGDRSRHGTVAGGEELQPSLGAIASSGCGCGAWSDSDTGACSGSVTMRCQSA